MIKLLTCNCGSAEPLVRQTLRSSGITTWLTEPIHKGKEHCLTVLSYFPEPYHELLAFKALQDHLSTTSSYAIIIGYDDSSFYWSDIHSNAPQEVIQAQSILERFA